MSNEANLLVPVSDEELDNADSMLASLSDIAYATNPVKSPKAQASKRKSRFFFKLSKSFNEELSNHKAVFVPKQLMHIDAEVEKRLREYKLEIPDELANNIHAVREFFLREIAPITLATGAGASQAREVVKRLVKSEIDGTQFEKFERMMALAVNIKMARFVARQLGLTKTEAIEILARMEPRMPHILPMGMPTNENQQRQKENTKAKNPP